MLYFDTVDAEKIKIRMKINLYSSNLKIHIDFY